MYMFKDLPAKINRLWVYWTDGIWRDTRQVWWVKVLKTVNISVKSFTNNDLQTQACAMTYRTALAIIPTLALLFAIGRGFGLQSVLTGELYSFFPGQKEVIDKSMDFVDGYLSQSTGEGAFVGIGLVFLLWTLISLIGSVESTFNLVWGVSQGRSIWRKITDYTAMLLILPVLLICASGLAIFVSSTLQRIFHFPFMTPLIKFGLEAASWVLTWLFFAAAYKLIPNTKVKITNALIAGVLAGTAFRVLQWLFVSGQLYVTRYNAIYGSFAFLPLLLLWIQLTWMVTISGALVCYSSQNIFLYALSSQVNNISPLYRYKVTIAVLATIVRRFDAPPDGGDAKPFTQFELGTHTGIPIRLVSHSLQKLMAAGLVNRVALDTGSQEYRYQPAIDPQAMTLGMVRRRLQTLGDDDFIPRFSKRFRTVIGAVTKIDNAADVQADTILIGDLLTETDSQSQRHQ